MSNVDWFIPVVKQAELTTADTTATELFVLPPDSKVIDIQVQTEDTVSAGAAIEIGISGDNDYYVDGTSVGTLGSVRASILVDTWLTCATAIYGLIDLTGAASGGPFMITLTYINKQHTRVP